MTTVSTKLKDRDWDVLIRSIERGNCILLLGQGLDVTSNNGVGRNLSTELARALSDSLEDEDIHVPEPTNLGLVAQMFQHTQNGREYLEAEVSRFFEDYRDTLPALRSEAFENLTALPFKMIITSRYDATLEHFLSKAQYAGKTKKPHVRIYDFQGVRQENLHSLGKPEEPLVYHLFGAPEIPDSLVITENDRLKFLQAVVRGEPKLPTDLTNEFVGKNFLFIGFGLPNYHLRMLMHVLGMGKSGLSFAMENLADTGVHDMPAGIFNESIIFYQFAGYRKLKMMDIPLDPFLAELRTRWEAVAPATPEEVVSTEAVANRSRNGGQDDNNRPKVFLSYSMEDVAVAERLAEVLEKNNLDPWWDKDKLQVGDRYDHSLEEAISTDVDFFVVLQSVALNGRLESYVHKEVALALNRHQMRGGIPFIFPVLIDSDAERVPALEREKLQTIEMTDVGDGGAVLADRIIGVARDIARQKRR